MKVKCNATNFDFSTMKNLNYDKLSVFCVGKLLRSACPQKPLVDVSF